MQKLNKKLGIIGVGNMGASILEGLLGKKLAQPSQLFLYDKIEEKAREAAQKYRTAFVPSNEGLVQKSEIILLAVKPQDLSETVRSFVSALTKKHILISILAGTPIAKIREIAGKSVQIVRAMPNLGAQVGHSMTVLAGDSKEALNTAQAIFDACGETVVLDEKYFDAVTAISGSGPAYFFLLMEFLTNEGKRYGLSDQDSQKLAIYTALGAGKLAWQAFEKGETAETLRKRVTSKGGTTEAALSLLFENHFPEIFEKAIKAAFDRGKELSKT